MGVITAVISTLERRLGRGRAVTILKWALPTLVVIIALVVFIASRPPWHLLDVSADALTPAQIRTLATTLLVHEDLDVRATAAEQLADAGDPAVPVLFELATSHRNLEVRQGVLLVLEQLDPEETARALQPLIEDEDAEIRRIAAWSAARLTNEASEAILLAAVSDTDPSVLNPAIEACIARRLSAAVPALQIAREHSSRSVQRHAARALEALETRRKRSR